MTNNDELDLTYAKMAVEKNNRIKNKEELTEIHRNNQERANGNRKNEYKKSKIAKKQMPILPINKKGAIAGLMITGMALAVGVTNYQCSEMICQKYLNEVASENTKKELDTMCIIDSEYSDGKKVSYIGENNNREEMYADLFANAIIEDGLNNGYTIDEMGIVVDWMGICHASDVQFVDLNGNEYYSTFLGRTAAKLKVLDEEIKSKHSGGRSL